MAKLNVAALSDKRVKELLGELEGELFNRGLLEEDPENEFVKLTASPEYKELDAKREEFEKALEELRTKALKDLRTQEDELYEKLEEIEVKFTQLEAKALGAWK